MGWSTYLPGPEDLLRRQPRSGTWSPYELLAVELSARYAAPYGSRPVAGLAAGGGSDEIEAAPNRCKRRTVCRFSAVAARRRVRRMRANDGRAVEATICRQGHTSAADGEAQAWVRSVRRRARAGLRRLTILACGAVVVAFPGRALAA